MRLRYTAFVIGFVVLWVLPTKAARPPAPADVSAQWAAYYATAYHVPVELVDAIIEVESQWNPYAISNKGAAGLMQLMPETAYRFGVRNRFVIPQNIRGGVAYLAWLMRLFHGDLRLVVASYYTGEERIMPRKLAYSSLETYEYVRRVAAVYRAIRRAEVVDEDCSRNTPLFRNQRSCSDRSAANCVEAPR